MERDVALATGTLSLRVDRGLWPLDALCDFATRRNPRRAFLIVSKVLGRHVPTPPALMRRSMRDLAAQVPDDLPGPTLVVGLAETAICLGQGVFQELARRAAFDGLYIHSTRQVIDHPLLCRFEEPHSHASAHLIYRPVDRDLSQFRSLVLVDDEISTGTTLANLARALIEHLPGVEQIVAASLTDWSAGAGWIAAMPRPTRSVSLLQGSLRWTPDGRSTPEEQPAFTAAAPRLGTLPDHQNFGRLGFAATQRLPIPRIPPPKSTKLRVIGTGEFTFPPFLLAETLARGGHDVVMQSTGRSPALPGGPIHRTLSFADNYATGLPNYLYNADPADGRASLICHETGADSIDAALVQALNATCISFRS